MTLQLSIGIPPLSGGKSLRRAIESALHQTLTDFQLGICYNGSTEDAPKICQEYARCDERVTRLGNDTIIPASEDFENVLKGASRELFIWLGQDDWIDPYHTRRCIRGLESGPSVMLLSGRPRSYRDGLHLPDGKILVAREKSTTWRALTYLLQVADNRTFYGLYGRATLSNILIMKVMAWDWLLLDSIAFDGQIVRFSDLALNAEAGGATRNHRAMGRSPQVPGWQGVFAYTATACGLPTDAAMHSQVFGNLTLLPRTRFGLGAAWCVASKQAWRHASATWSPNQLASREGPQ